MVSTRFTHKKHENDPGNNCEHSSRARLCQYYNNFSCKHCSNISGYISEWCLWWNTQKHRNSFSPYWEMYAAMVLSIHCLHSRCISLPILLLPRIAHSIFSLLIHTVCCISLTVVYTMELLIMIRLSYKPANCWYTPKHWLPVLLIVLYSR